MLQIESNDKWYQIYTKTNSEMKLYNKIIKYGFQAFIPIRITSKTWSDRVKTIEEPAFKSYIFAKLNYNQMRFVEQLTDFGFFVSYGCPGKNQGQEISKHYPALTDTTIAQIAQILIEYPQAILKENALIKGDKIEITRGSLKNYQGILIHQPSGNKVAVKIYGLKQSLIITVPMYLMRKIV